MAAAAVAAAPSRARTPAEIELHNQELREQLRQLREQLDSKRARWLAKPSGRQLVLSRNLYAEASTLAHYKAAEFSRRTASEADRKLSERRTDWRSMLPDITDGLRRPHGLSSTVKLPPPAARAAPWPKRSASVRVAPTSPAVLREEDDEDDLAMFASAPVSPVAAKSPTSIEDAPAAAPVSPQPRKTAQELAAERAADKAAKLAAEKEAKAKAAADKLAREQDAKAARLAKEQEDKAARTRKAAHKKWLQEKDLFDPSPIRAEYQSTTRL
jgi:hypothetical protein